MKGLLYKSFLLYRGELITILIGQLLVSGIVIFYSVTSKIVTMNSAECLALYFCVFLVASLFENQLFMPDEKRAFSSFILSIREDVKLFG